MSPEPTFSSRPMQPYMKVAFEKEAYSRRQSVLTVEKGSSLSQR